MIDSIKLKLITWFLVVFTVIFTSLGFFLYFELKEIVISSVDEHLHSEVTFLAGILASEAEQGNIEEGVAEITRAATGSYSVALSGHYYQILDDKGGILGRSPSLFLADKNLRVVKTTYETIFETNDGPTNGDYGDHRMVSQSFEFSGRIITFQASDSLKDSYSILKSFRNIISIALPLIYLLSVSGIYLISKFALKTLNVFSNQVGQITARSLGERVEEENIDDELRPVARSFNTMLSRLEKAFARQREFLSDASHELRTPTSIIKTRCDVTLRRERSNEEYRSAIVTIKDTSARMTSIIERILDASRIESSIFNMKMEQVNLNEIISDAVKLIEPSATESGINIDFTSPGQYVIKGDRERVSEVFVNFIENAVKYNRRGGSVIIELGFDEDFAVATVADTGIGIPEDEKEKIFERFYRVDKSREVVQGTGLGLSIVKAIVESHQGRIEFESVFGEGSTFKVYFPLA